MHTRMTVVSVVLFLIASQLSAAADRYPRLEELYIGKQFFDLRERFTPTGTISRGSLFCIQKYLKQVGVSKGRDR
jgi:hypothetical protein